MVNLENELVNENLPELERLFDSGKYNINGIYTLCGEGIKLRNVSPLYFSIMLNKINTIKFLLDKGANINYCEKPLLHEYCSQTLLTFPRLNVIKLLINSGSDTTYKDESGRNFIDYITGRLSEAELENIKMYEYYS
jgi:ankyrin repeat protein